MHCAVLRMAASNGLNFKNELHELIHSGLIVQEGLGRVQCQGVDDYKERIFWKHKSSSKQLGQMHGSGQAQRSPDLSIERGGGREVHS